MVLHLYSLIFVRYGILLPVKIRKCMIVQVFDISVSPNSPTVQEVLLMPNHSKGYRAEEVARTFFKACTKLSDNKEDILPQVRGRDI